ncbi:MAG: hypothetical protein MUP66_01435 [Candidatus Nanohaloarchaeota archaeon QJJ-5]|nr:hypothetical protein [Candidatus Nanohaloarchaeota archaeon QJJ-5]
MLPPYRVLVAQDETAENGPVITRTLRDIGYETIYCERDRFDHLAHDALQEDVDAVVYLTDTIEHETTQADEFMRGRKLITSDEYEELSSIQEAIMQDDWERIDGVGPTTSQYLAEEGLRPDDEMDAIEAVLDTVYEPATKAPIYTRIMEEQA